MYRSVFWVWIYVSRLASLSTSRHLCLNWILDRLTLHSFCKLSSLGAMPTSKSVLQHKKKLRRNFIGLLSKAHKYGKLRGVELGLYVKYTDRYAIYESEGFSCSGYIDEMVRIAVRYVSSEPDKE